MLVTVGLQVGVDAVGVDEGELAEGGFPAVDGGAFDQAGDGLAIGALAGGLLGAFAGAFVLDVPDRQPQELDDGLVAGEVAAVLDDLAQLVVERLDRYLEPLRGCR